MNIETSFKRAEPVTSLREEMDELHGRLVGLKGLSALLSYAMVHDLGEGPDKHHWPAVAGGVISLADHVKSETASVTDQFENLLPPSGESQ